jgi:hypothetical protein
MASTKIVEVLGLTGQGRPRALVGEVSAQGHDPACIDQQFVTEFQVRLSREANTIHFLQSRHFDARSHITLPYAVYAKDSHPFTALSVAKRDNPPTKYNVCALLGLLNVRRNAITGYG